MGAKQPRPQAELPTGEAPTPFKIEVEDSVLQDLKDRLKRTKLPSSFDTQGMHYGMPDRLQAQLLEYWQNKYDWRAAEKELNSFSHFKMPVQGLSMHFIHEECTENPDAIPLLLVHGWPGSVWEFHNAIPKLRALKKYHLIIPSLPGYGWSEAPKEPGFHLKRVASVLNELMLRLGYRHYVAQGGDWGAMITKNIAYDFPNNCVALHQNMSMTEPNQSMFTYFKMFIDLSPLNKLTLNARDRERLERTKHLMLSGSAYCHIQASKPQSLGYGLEDSPSGLLAWIGEKQMLWVQNGAKDEGQGLLDSLSEDEILTPVMIYWITNSITSSMRLYYEAVPFFKQKGDVVEETVGSPIRQPVGLANYPGEIYAEPLKWAKYSYKKVVHVSHPPKGGHFAAWEVPDLFVQDIDEFVSKSIGPFHKVVAAAEKRRPPPAPKNKKKQPSVNSRKAGSVPGKDKNRAVEAAV